MALCPPAVTMFGYVRICLRVLSISKIPRRGGPPCPPEHGGTAIMDIACAVDASGSCRPLAPPMMNASLSAPGPHAPHSTALRAATFELDDC
jgi:hypothetical protein